MITDSATRYRLRMLFEIASSFTSTCARRANGAVHCWGTHALRNGSGLTHSTPVAVRGITDATSLTGGLQHFCVTTAAHGLLCWGSSEFGQLGDGTFDRRSTPVSVLW